MRLFYPSFFLLATPNLHRADFSSASGHGAPTAESPAPSTAKPPQQTENNPSTASSPASLPPPRHALRPRTLPSPAPLRAAHPRRRAVPPCRLFDEYRALKACPQRGIMVYNVRIASKRKRTERNGCVKNERTQGNTEHGRYASVFRHARMDATSRCRGRGLGSGRVAPPHSLEQCRREDSKGDEREALSFGPRGQGRRTASPARLHSDG